MRKILIITLFLILISVPPVQAQFFGGGGTSLEFDIDAPGASGALLQSDGTKWERMTTLNINEMNLPSSDADPSTTAGQTKHDSVDTNSSTGGDVKWFGGSIGFGTGGSTGIAVVGNSTGSTFNRGDFTVGNAFLWSSLDLSPYAGTDLGSTPYYIELLDGAGKKATGYIAGIGAGETLGSELVTVGWTNSSSPFETFVSSGVDITSAINTLEYGFANADIVSIIEKQLYKTAFNLTLNSGTAPKYGILQATTGAIGADESVVCDVGANSIYINGVQYTVYPTFWVNYAIATNFAASGFTLKRVIDPPATAVHIVSSLNGTTRNWASIESGFNPNTITSWDIYAGSGSMIFE